MTADMATELWLLSAVLLACVASSSQLGGGCLASDFPFQSQPGPNHDYELQYPVMSSVPVQDVHLAFQGPQKMRVAWMNPAPWTSASDFTPVCSFGQSATALTTNVTGQAYSYPDGDFSRTLNMATLELPVSTGTIFYRCGDGKYGWSHVFNFTLQPTSSSKGQGDVNPTIAFVADMGVEKGMDTISSIAKRVKSGAIKLLVHAGDISYADKFGGKTRNNSNVWVDYMNKLQPITSRVPYMVAPGNHEAEFKFAAYLNWFKMPSAESGSTSPFWYSFDYMGIHFVAMSTEHDFSINSTQYNWIEQDLKKANQNRKQVPWIIVFGHRPLYCSSIVCIERCDIEAPRFRKEIEDLLYYQNVNIFMSGHNHQYERSYPVFKKRLAQKDYTNPLSPVYIVNGAAGNPEPNDPTFMPLVRWRAHKEATFDTGYLLLQPAERELQFQYVLSKDDKVVDNFIMKTTPY